MAERSYEPTSSCFYVPSLFIHLFVIGVNLNKLSKLVRVSVTKDTRLVKRNHYEQSVRFLRKRRQRNEERQEITPIPCANHSAANIAPIIWGLGENTANKKTRSHFNFVLQTRSVCTFNFVFSSISLEEQFR